MSASPPSSPFGPAPGSRGPPAPVPQPPLPGPRGGSLTTPPAAGAGGEGGRGEGAGNRERAGKPGQVAGEEGARPPPRGPGGGSARGKKKGWRRAYEVVTAAGPTFDMGRSQRIAQRVKDSLAAGAAIAKRSAALLGGSP